MDLILDSIRDIIASCVVIGFGVNVLAFSMRVFMLLVLNMSEMVSFLRKKPYGVTF